MLQGRYRLEGELARGAMGTIFAAMDERLGRRVAIKVPRGALAMDEDFLERFRREALAAAALSHPNIASVFDYGQERGQPFIVMELVTGRDLAQILEQGPLSPGRAAAIAEQVSAALAHAHQAGVIHRDIKPANIIVSVEDGDRVKVTDFGIAKATGDLTITATGAMFGTPQYISPEQAQGEPATARSDIYSLGIVLYEMLVGAPPFEGGTMVALAMRHVNDEVGPPSSVAPGIPPSLDRIVLKATAKDPEQRFHTAGEMLEALDPSAPLVAEPIADEVAEDETAAEPDLVLPDDASIAEGAATVVQTNDPTGTVELDPEPAPTTTELPVKPVVRTRAGATRQPKTTKKMFSAKKKSPWDFFKRPEVIVGIVVGLLIVGFGAFFLNSDDEPTAKPNPVTRQEKLDGAIDVLEGLVQR
jgi:serine/threonine-protein kinase